MSDCILKTCAHVGAAGAPCRALGSCGAEEAMRMARGNGYRAHIDDNPTVRALVDAGLVVVVPFPREGMVRAKDRA